GVITHLQHPAQPHRSAILGLCENPATGELWIAHDGDGLFRLHGDSIERVELLGREWENLQTLCLDREGALWIGTQREGILRYKDREVSQFSTEDGLPSDYVISLFADPEGSIWAGTLFGGLNRLHRARVRTFGRKEGFDRE